MKKKLLSILLNEISQLNKSDRVEVSNLIQQLDDDNKVISMIESSLDEKHCCPHCRNEKYTKHGFAHGLQRYQCKSCNKTFNTLTGTPLARLRLKKNWLNYLSAICDSKSVRKAAKQVGISIPTSFKWRHRFLELISENRPEKLTGIIEADETYFLYSEKGNKKISEIRPARKRGGKAKQRGLSKEQVCVFVARDRTGSTTDYVVGRGNISASSVKECLEPSLDKDGFLISDKNHAYQKFSRENKITHIGLKGGRPDKNNGAYHIQNINSYHSRLKVWMVKFKGVATKYLHHYMGWQRSLDQFKNITPEQLLFSSVGIYQHLT